MNNSVSELSFNQIYLEYRPALNRFLLKLSGNPQDAADLMQETFLKYYQKGMECESAKAWLFQTGYHLFIDNWRKKQKISWSPLESVPEPVSDLASCPEVLFLSLEMKQGLFQILEQLKPQTRSAVLLRAETDASYQEIALQMGCSENTVKSAIRRARFKMNQMASREKKPV